MTAQPIPAALLERLVALPADEAAGIVALLAKVIEATERRARNRAAVRAHRPRRMVTPRAPRSAYLGRIELP